jgi:PAS domain S-box-containing protein
MKPSAALILNVDDNDGARYAKTRILQVAGFNVIEAVNGTEALALVAERRPDLVLLDVKLPDVNGIEVCRRIKSDPASATVLVLQTSAALTGSADKIRGLEGGADNYLAAPIEAAELIANVNALLRLRRTQAALRESEERFRQMAENIDDVFWIFSFADRTLQYVSPAYAMLWGNSAGTLLQDATQWLERVHADDREHVRESFDGLFHGPAYAEEYRVMQPDGSIRWVRDRAFPVKDQNGTVFRIARITSDISAAKNAEHVLQDADSHKDQFLATLAHEMRSPLGPIRNAVELMRRTEPVESQVHHQARDIITRQVDHLARLVDDLLDVARISQGKIALQKTEVELSIFVDAAVEITRPLIESRAHTLDVRLPSGKVWIKGDPVRLAQAIANLLNNAAKYTPRGGKITVEAKLEDDAVNITISDTGIGIAPERSAAIFELFSQGQTAPDRAQDGLGIGLSLVKQLVDLHGGRISVLSGGIGQGATFCVVLPVMKIDSDSGESPPFPAIAEPAKSVGKVLIVDDNQDALSMTSMLLSTLGYETITAYDSISALASAKQHLPDVVLLDIGLPGADGYQVARMLREQPELRHARLIALTGYGAARDRQRAAEAGFDHHLVKPVDINKLVDCIEAHGESS